MHENLQCTTSPSMVTDERTVTRTGTVIDGASESRLKGGGAALIVRAIFHYSRLSRDVKYK